MFKRILRFMYSHFCENKILYFLSVGAAIFGILLGIAGGKNFSDSDYLTAFFGGLSDVSKSALWLRAFGSALLISSLAAIFGLSPIGFAALPIIDAYRGFAFGFSAAAFYSVYGFKSVVFILLALVIPALLWMPPLVFASVNSIRSSLSMLKICRRRTSPEFSCDAKFMLISCAVMFLFMLISRLAEIYIVPPILNVVSGLYM